MDASAWLGGEDVSCESLIPFVQATVHEGSIVDTDGWRSYDGLKKVGYDRRQKPISGSRDLAKVVMLRVQRVAVLLDRWWLGIHQGAISARHLDYYLDEFTFRFNRRGSWDRGMLFYRLIQQALLVEPAPYKRLAKGKERE